MLMRALRAALSCLMLLGVISLGAGPPALATGHGDCLRCPPAAVKGGEGGVTVGVVKGVTGAIPGRGGGMNGPAPDRTEWMTVEEYITPACSANGLMGSDALCAAAFSCPAGDQLRYWVWHRTTQWQAGPPVASQVGEWAMETGSFCIGPDDPGITAIGGVIAAVQTGFQQLPLPAFAPQIRPVPTTLVNVPTSFAAGSAEPVTLQTAPLGIGVTVVATPVEWFWTFGDGSTLTTTFPGRPGTDDITHVYERAQSFGVSVRVTWTGTFSLDSNPGEAFPIRSPAFVQGPVAQVAVREARTELVRD